MKKSSCLHLNDIDLRCCSKKSTLFCKQCEACLLNDRCNETKAWFIPLSYDGKKSFLLTLVYACNNVKNILNGIFHSFKSKDFKYSKTRIKTDIHDGYYEDKTNHSLNMRQISPMLHERYYNWFHESSDWSKRNYLYHVLQLCSNDLINAVRDSIDDWLVSSSDDDEEEILYSAIDESNKIATYKPALRPKSALKNKNRDTKRNWSARRDVAFADDFKASFGKTNSRISSRPDSGFSRRNSKLQFVESSISSARCTPIAASHSSTPSLMFSTPLSPDYISEIVPPYKAIHSYVDFLKSLPVHLSKKILGYLNEACIKRAANVCKQWNILAKEVLAEVILLQIAREDIMLMQAGSSKLPNPSYARRVPVHIPLQEKNGAVISNIESKHIDIEALHDEFQDINMEDCYEGLETKLVDIEERNVYCGSYNIFVAEPHKDAHRCFNSNNGDHLVLGSIDRKIHMLNINSGKCVTTISGHTGSVKCVYIDEKKGHILSGSYDLTVRVWDMYAGRCKFLFRGHKGTIIVVTADNDYVVSSSTDKCVKVWNLLTNRCKRTFRHNTPVRHIVIKDNVMLTGCISGNIFVWDIEQAVITKSFEGHTMMISGLHITPYHIVSSSYDGYAILWSKVKKLKKPLRKFRHPKEVLCLSVSYCRVITGCSDGKIRVLNMLNGECLRVIRGNSKNDAILNLAASDNRLVVNTLNCVLVYNFEPVTFDYTAPRGRSNNITRPNIFPPKVQAPYSVVRAEKIRTHGSPIHKIRTATLSNEIINSIARVQSAPFSLESGKMERPTTSSVNKHIRRIKSAQTFNRSLPTQTSISQGPIQTVKTLSRIKLLNNNYVVEESLSKCRSRTNRTVVESSNEKNKSVNMKEARCKSAPTYALHASNKKLQTSSFIYSDIPLNKMIPNVPKKLIRCKTAHALKRVPSEYENLNIKSYYKQLEFEERLRKI